MCGIAGMFGKFASSDKVAMMVGAMHRRGPDDSGVWFDTERGVGLGHARLSIIDLSSAGHQPMFLEGAETQDQQRDIKTSEYHAAEFAIVFNGEIYNYKELRTELEAKGALFRNHSDTEVILWGWKIWGKETPKRLRGMFAFAIWDRRNESLTLVRDRIGIKPLLWYQSAEGIVFASSMKAMFASGVVQRVLNEQGFFDYLIFGAVCQPRTIIKGVVSLEPGKMIEFQVGHGNQSGLPARTIGAVKAERYWSLERNEELALELEKLPYDEQVRITRQNLEEACKYHLIADVSVGSFLSGGVDSTVITALMARQSNYPVKSFSIGFSSETGMKNELTEARTAAEFIGCDHTEVFLSGKDVAYHFDDFIDSIDQPSVDGLNTYWVSKVAHENGLKVALSGLGSDELFAGYDFFDWFVTDSMSTKVSWVDSLLAKMYRLYPRGRWMRKAFLKTSTTQEKFAAIRTIMKDGDVRRVVVPELCKGFSEGHALQYIDGLGLNANDSIAKTTQYEGQNYLLNTLLRDADALSMAHSLEVRPIFLDHQLVEFALALPAKSKLKNGTGKAILKDASKDLLPPDFFKRKKTGFTLPIDYWMENELHERLVEVVRNDRAAHYFNKSILVDLKKVNPSSGNRKRMWQLLVFLSWMESSGITIADGG